MICVAVAVPNSGEGAEGRGGWETEADPGPLIWHRQHLVREVGLFLFLFFFFFLVIEPVQYFLLESLCLIGRGVEVGTAPEKWKGNRGYVLCVMFAFGVNCWDLQLCWAKHSWNGEDHCIRKQLSAEPHWRLLPGNAGLLFGCWIFFSLSSCCCWPESHWFLYFLTCHELCIIKHEHFFICLTFFYSK